MASEPRKIIESQLWFVNANIDRVSHLMGFGWPLTTVASLQTDRHSPSAPVNEAWCRKATYLVQTDLSFCFDYEHDKVCLSGLRSASLL